MVHPLSFPLGTRHFYLIVSERGWGFSLALLALILKGIQREHE